ncbi:MAG: DNA repair helicase XPB, partial [Planctomycetota bacterium]
MIVQSDYSILLEVGAPGAEEARDDLLRFAELVRSPEHVHTYRLTPLSLWNAAAAGHGAESVLAALERHARFPVPQNVRAFVLEQGRRYGQTCLRAKGDELVLDVATAHLAEHLWRQDSIRKFIVARRDELSFFVQPGLRGNLKQALIKIGFPVEDLAGYVDGAPIEVALGAVELRPYQSEAVAAFLREGTGVIVLPCGAGKTIVGIAAIAALRTRTLVITTGTAAARQWRGELLGKTTLPAEEVVELTGETSRKRPRRDAAVTVTTYQLLSHRERGEFPHMERAKEADFGLIVYDEVHLLPAPVFRLTAELQARRRLGLTATLLREDGCEDDVFALVGPKRHDVPWRELEQAGWIAEASCTEIRVPLHESRREEYALGKPRELPRIAAENEAKLPVVARLLDEHAEEPILVLGTYVEQLHRIGALVDAPVITGETSAAERDVLYEDFRAGRIGTLVLSRVGNYAIDLPEASVAIQVSGTFGSRQEEAQRLGRVLRPKRAGRRARLYTIVT